MEPRLGALVLLCLLAAGCERVQPTGNPQVQAIEAVSGAGRVQGGSLTIDVQVGHPVRHGPVGNGRESAESSAVLKH